MPALSTVEEHRMVVTRRRGIAPGTRAVPRPEGQNNNNGASKKRSSSSSSSDEAEGGFKNELALSSEPPSTFKGALSRGLNLDAILDVFERMFCDDHGHNNHRYAIDENRSTDETEDDDSSRDGDGEDGDGSGPATHRRKPVPQRGRLRRRRCRTKPEPRQEPQPQHHHQQQDQQLPSQQLQQQRRDRKMNKKKKVTFAGAKYDEDRGKVVFHPLHVVSLVLHHRDYTPEEIRSGWYTRSELSAIGAECFQTAVAVARNAPQLYSHRMYRGLEGLIDQAARAAYRPTIREDNTLEWRKEGLRMVLAEQRRQLLAHVRDPERIRAVLETHGRTERTRRFAHFRGLQDEACIRRAAPAAEERGSVTTTTKHQHRHQHQHQHQHHPQAHKQKQQQQPQQEQRRRTKTGRNKKLSWRLLKGSSSSQQKRRR